MVLFKNPSIPFIRMASSLGYNSVEAAVDNSGGTAGLTDDKVLSGHKTNNLLIDNLVRL